MGKERSNNRRRGHAGGQSLVEVVVALAVFIVGVATIGFLVIDAYFFLQLQTDRTVAYGLAREGIEAVRSIRTDDFDNLATGTYGIEESAGRWVLSPPPDVTDGFTRTIAISDEGNEVRSITSAVTWEVRDFRTATASLTTYLTDWQQTEGDAAAFSLDGAGAFLSASGTVLEGASLTNAGVDDLTITDMIVSWNAPALLTSIAIDGISVWSSSGTGSGVTLDVSDHTLPTGASHPFELTFNGDIDGTDVLLTGTLNDGSSNHGYIDL